MPRPPRRTNTSRTTRPRDQTNGRAHGFRVFATLLLLIGAAGGGYLGLNRQHQERLTAAESAFDVEASLAALDQAKLYAARADLDPAVQAAVDKAAAEAKTQADKTKKANDMAERAKAASRAANRTPPDYGPIPASCKEFDGNRGIGCAELLLAGFGLDQMPCLNKLWTRESNWRTAAENTSSGAYGIPQALPGSKMASIADDWQTNPATQIKWGLGYIKNRYKTPCNAWDHSEATGWY